MLAVSRIALTLGEPAGIGPDICIKMAQENLPCEVVVVGSAELLQQRAQRLGLNLSLYEFDPLAPKRMNGQGHLAIVDIPLKTNCIPGELDVANSAYVLNALNHAYELCATNRTDALVTGPIHKAIIHLSGVAFSGHTEYLAKLANVEDVLMTFYTPKVILGLVTTHCALNQVSTTLTQHRVERAIEILHDGLENVFHHHHPKIHVCGVNPHAGEAGTIGKEEERIIIPALQASRQKGFDLMGPISADTAFAPKQLDSIEAILAMYHDQGLAPLKALFFGDIVNITLGLPFLRTSVDHGTALSLAGTQLADSSSLVKAIHVAKQFSQTANMSCYV
jgi:4-hydroxythreonine-4-phosphate dehydrogenase